MSLDGQIISPEINSLAPSEREIIFKGSKTFSAASLLFKEPQREGAWSLYSWCRFVDDEIDQCEEKKEVLQKLYEVKEKTHLAFAGAAHWAPYFALQKTAIKFQLQETQALDLVRGLEWDATQTRIQNWEELKDYCYCVAGTVGLMMSAIMGVKNDEAHEPALKLGEAMQLTNIARDIHEDLNLGRIYIPQTWLQEFGVTESDFKAEPRSRIPLMLKLLETAEGSYKAGLSGLRYLPFRAAWAVGSAGLIYREIGRQIKRSPTTYLTKRSVVPLPKKLFLILSALILTLKSRGSHAP